MGKDSKGSESAGLVNGEDKRTKYKRSDSPTYRPCKSIETWLQGTSDIKPDTSTTSRKRKRSNPSIAAPSTPPEISESFLNLEEIQFKMPPTTPSNPKTNKSQTTKASTKADAGFVRQRLAQHGMYQGDDKAFRSYPAFQKMVYEIVRGERHSAPRPKSVEAFQRRHKYHRSDNELTVLDNLIPMIIKARRQVPLQYSSIKPPVTGSLQEAPEFYPAPSDGECTWVVEDFFDSGCIRKANADFKPNSLPLDKDLAAMMKKDDDMQGLTNPRPDYVYGLSCDDFEPPKGVIISGITQDLREVIPHMYDCMFVIEGKSDQGQPAGAENQACRSGAALVNAARQLRERIGEKDVEGADERTFVFSGTLCPNALQIWVNWAEVTYTNGKKNVFFHMNHLDSGTLSSSDFVERFRPICHNILDWGCITRYHKNLKGLYERIYEWETDRIEKAKFMLAQKPEEPTDSSQTGSKRQKTN